MMYIIALFVEEVKRTGFMLKDNDSSNRNNIVGQTTGRWLDKCCV